MKRTFVLAVLWRVAYASRVHTSRQISITKQVALEPGRTLALAPTEVITDQPGTVSVSKDLQPGACTKTDMEQLWKLGPGYENGTLAHLNTACGKKSVLNMKLKFLKDSHVECMQTKIPISRPCGLCFASNSKYGYENCKLACWKNWCSKECLECVDQDADRLETCVGGKTPQHWACDGSDYGKPIDYSDGVYEDTSPTDTVDVDARVVSPEEEGWVKLPGNDSLPIPSAEELQVEAVWKQKGQCNYADMKLLSESQSGNVRDSFAKMAADCGSHCVTWTLSMGEQCYNTCLRRKIALSESCATCFLGSAKFGLDSCKTACMSSWCSKSCLQCVDPYQAKVRECVGFQPPVAWACDGSDWGKPKPNTTKPAQELTPDTETSQTKRWQPEKALPLGHTVSFYNSASGRFLRMDGEALVSGSEKKASDGVQDDERFSVVDASGDGTGEVIALYSKVRGRCITITKGRGTHGAEAATVIEMASTMPHISTSAVADVHSPPKQAQLAVVSVSGYGNIKAVALGSPNEAGKADRFIAMDSQGGLLLVPLSPSMGNSSLLARTLDSKDGSTFVVVDHGGNSDDGTALFHGLSIRNPETGESQQRDNESAASALAIPVYCGIALILGAVGGYLLAKRMMTASIDGGSWITQDEAVSMQAQ